MTTNRFFVGLRGLGAGHQLDERSEPQAIIGIANASCKKCIDLRNLFTRSRRRINLGHEAPCSSIAGFSSGLLRRNSNALWLN
ncbi:hypothetical protein [Burkholderia ambifaria]|uniref:hypothetical protein n=1 Tax=Burkholderia ambifaria TaxID=152480 RepID=UPI00158AA329|nr:hypothetical protein [Burkholderia ambifaria]